MATSQQPNPLFQMKKQVEIYGHVEAGREDPPPTTLDDVACRLRAAHQFVWKKSDDTDDLGLVKSRQGWYVSEDYIKGFFMYFFDFMH